MTMQKKSHQRPREIEIWHRRSLGTAIDRPYTFDTVFRIVHASGRLRDRLRAGRMLKRPNP